MNFLSSQLKGMLFLTGAFALAGTSVISARFVAGRLGTFTITAVSLFFALLFLVPLAGSRIIESVRGASARDWAYLFLQAVFGIFLFRMFLLLGLLHTSSAEAGILTGATPAITAVLAGAFLKETMNACKIIGILSTVAGILFVQGLLMPGKCFMTEHVSGNVLVLCAAACESFFNVCSRVAVVKARPDDKDAMPPTAKTALVSFIAMFLCLVPACFERPAALLAGLGLQGWLALIWYGVFVTALAFLFWYSGIKRCRATTAAAFSGLMPFTALLLSVLILGEHAAIQQWCGGILVISGMALIGLEAADREIEKSFKWERIGESKCLRSKMNCLKHQSSVWWAFLSCRASATLISAKRWTRQDASWKRKSGRGTGRCPGRN